LTLKKKVRRCSEIFKIHIQKKKNLRERGDNGGKDLHLRKRARRKEKEERRRRRRRRRRKRKHATRR